MAIPPVAEVVQVQVALRGIAVEHHHVEVTVRILPFCAKYHPNHHPLNTLGVESYLGSKILQYFVPSNFIF